MHYCFVENVVLLPSAARAYELAEWKKAIVEYNYHVLTDGHYYSVPYEYIKREVDVRLTRNVVEVFSDGSRICSHVRLYDRRNVYSTQQSHMPPNHQEYSQWNGDSFPFMGGENRRKYYCCCRSAFCRIQG